MNQSLIPICYHYIRTPKNNFPRIIGNSESEFINHVEMISSHFNIINPDQVLIFFNSKISAKNIKNILFTFDDGLSDHFKASEILSSYNIKALFFIPTCIIEDGMPANPMIIHYVIANYGIKKFINKYYECVNRLVEFKERKNYKLENYKNVWEKIDAIKNKFKYEINYKLSRKILLGIYKDLFLEDFPDAMDVIHLNEDKIRKMIDMGHSIGTHSHTHISIADETVSPQDLKKELIEPKYILENTFKENIKYFSYPFGDKKDCFSSADLLEKTKKLFLCIYY